MNQNSTIPNQSVIKNSTGRNFLMMMKMKYQFTSFTQYFEIHSQMHSLSLEYSKITFECIVNISYDPSNVLYRPLE